MAGNPEIIISVDVEADGPLPSINSLLSIGAAAFNSSGLVLEVFQVNLQPLPTATEDPETMAWWYKQPLEIYLAARTDPQPAEKAIEKFVTWIESLPGNPAVLCSTDMIGYPAGYDLFLWLYWYLVRFHGKSPFSFSFIDIKTLAWIALGGKFKEAGKRNFRVEWFPTNQSHTHRAVDDALEQGIMAFRIIDEIRKRLLPYGMMVSTDEQGSITIDYPN